jgi:hypothetical protein
MQSKYKYISASMTLSTTNLSYLMPMQYEKLNTEKQRKEMEGA